jgi:hypothetical protein
MYLPSGVHSGLWYVFVLPRVICAVSFLSSDMVQRFQPPSRSETKTTFLPSGEKRGCPSKAMPRVSGTAFPPPIGIV